MERMYEQVPTQTQPTGTKWIPDVGKWSVAGMFGRMVGVVLIVMSGVLCWGVTWVWGWMMDKGGSVIHTITTPSPSSHQTIDGAQYGCKPDEWIVSWDTPEGKRYSCTKRW